MRNNFNGRRGDTHNNNSFSEIADVRKETDLKRRKEKAPQSKCQTRNKLRDKLQIEDAVTRTIIKSRFNQIADAREGTDIKAKGKRGGPAMERPHPPLQHPLIAFVRFRAFH